MNPKETFINRLGNKIQNFSLNPKVSGTSANMSVKPINMSSVSSATSPNMSVKPTTPTGLNMTMKPTNAPNISNNIPVKPQEKPQTPLPEAGQKFVQSLYDAKTGARTEYGASQGATDMFGGKPVIKEPTITTPTPTTPIQTPTPESPYKKYIDAMMSDAQRVADIKSQSEAKELEARRGYEEALDRPGGLVGGARESAGLISRRSNQELADLALRESAAARTAGLSTEAYKQFQTENAPIEVGGQLYQKQPDGTYKSVAGGTRVVGTTGTTTSDLPALAKEYEYAKNQGYTGTFTQYQNEKTSGTLGTSATNVKNDDDQLNFLTDNLNTAKKYADASGRSGLRKTVEELFVGSTDYTNLEAATNSLRTNVLSLMTDPAIKKFFGPQMSNDDVQLMTSAGTSLNPELQDPSNMKTELKRLEDLITRMKSAVIKGTNETQTISSDEEEYLRSKGYTDTEIKSLKDFNSVGNTRASNIPQKNKNPGNIKQGGLADSLAIGMDNQGHLIFPDEETGFKAMQMDIEAKIKGNSKYLPANPTIAQLGKVYAEDPKWSNSVAKILGVTPLTPTSKIPINNLVKAIARQEGYYA